jgi:hypothetical protein
MVLYFMSSSLHCPALLTGSQSSARRTQLPTWTTCSASQPFWHPLGLLPSEPADAKRAVLLAGSQFSARRGQNLASASSSAAGPLGTS